MKIKPRHNVVIVNREETERESEGGIILPKAIKGKPRIGTVLEVGSGGYDSEGKFHTAGVEVGDRIAWNMAHEKTYEIGSKSVTFVKGEGILGKI
jgi:chaperonin GroES